MAELFNDVLGSDASASETSTESIVETVQESVAETVPTTTEEITETESTESESIVDDESLTDEEKLLKELEKEIEDEKTPAFYRNKMKASLDNFNKLRESVTGETTVLKTELETLKANRAYEEQDLQRFKTAEEKVNTLSSIAATPDQILSTLAELNPRVLPQVQQKLIWSAIEKPDGTPDLNNLQSIVDRFAGTEKPVLAKDVLSAIEAIQSGRVDPLDFEEYYTEEQRIAAARNRQYEQANAERAQILDREIEATESRARQEVLDSQVSSWMGQVKSHAETLLTKFHLAEKNDDLPEVKEFKASIKSKLINAISETESKSLYFKEITTAINLLKQPNKMTRDRAEEEIKSYFSNPYVQSKLNAGLAEINKSVEQVILKEAKLHTILQKGLEVMQKEKVATARPIAKSSAESTPKQYTEAEIAKMSGTDRYNLGMEAFSNKLREQALKRS